MHDFTTLTQGGLQSLKAHECSRFVTCLRQSKPLELLASRPFSYGMACEATPVSVLLGRLQEVILSFMTVLWNEAQVDSFRFST